MEDQDIPRIVCARWDEPHGDDAKVTYCANCMIEIAISPSSLAMIEAKEPHEQFKVVCSYCMQGEIDSLDGDEELVFDTAPQAEVDFKAAVAELNELTDEEKREVYKNL